MKDLIKKSHHAQNYQVDGPDEKNWVTLRNQKEASVGDLRI
jgi:hypothetical protein